MIISFSPSGIKLKKEGEAYLVEYDDIKAVETSTLPLKAQYIFSK